MITSSAVRAETRDFSISGFVFLRDTWSPNLNVAVEERRHQPRYRRDPSADVTGKIKYQTVVPAGRIQCAVNLHVLEIELVHFPDQQLITKRFEPIAPFRGHIGTSPGD